MSKYTVILVALFLLNLLPNNSNAQQVIIIVNKDVSEDKFDHHTLQRIYHGKKKQWSDKKKIVPVMLKSGSVHETFIEEILMVSEVYDDTEK